MDHLLLVYGPWSTFGKVEYGQYCECLTFQTVNELEITEVVNPFPFYDKTGNCP